MNFLTLLMGVAFGVVLGYLLCFFLQKKRIVMLEEAVDDAREEMNYIKNETGSKLQDEQVKVMALREELSAAKRKAKKKTKDYPQVSDQQIKDLETLRSSLKKSESARVAAVNGAETYKKSWHEAEKRFQQGQTQANQMVQRISLLEKHVRISDQEIKSLNQILERKDKEIKLSKAASTLMDGASGRPRRATSELFLNAGGDLEKVLRVLVDSEKQNVCVLADNNGIVVAASGDSALQEGMAATAKLVEGLTLQLDGMVPFSKLRSFALRDDNSVVICGKTFECAGETLGLATYGPTEPADRVLSGAMNNLNDILG